MTSAVQPSATESLTDDRLPPMPYPGLRPFRKSEWSIFFGRDRMINDVLQRLAKTKLVVVHGASGSGKSSLILAGVLPRLELEHARHGISWKTATMRPGSAPLWNLAEAIATLVHDGSSDEDIPLSLVRGIRRVLNRGKRALGDLVKLEGIELGKHGHVCLVLDQFEELFRFAREIDRDEAEILSEVLLGFEGDPPPGVHGIVTMRSDHLGDCGRFQGLAELINQTQYLLPRMDRDALLRAIREPARLYHGQVTIDLALKLIEDSAGEQDALPLVQHCLMRLWRAEEQDETSRSPGLAEEAAPFDSGRHQTSPRILDLPSYRGLRETLSEHADEILAELIKADPEAEKLVEYLFRALTEVDAEGRAIRNPHRLHQLVAIGGEMKKTALIRIIDRLRADDCSFLTPLAGHPIDDETMIDIGHEALIRCWRRLDDPRIDKETSLPRGWLQREQEDERLWRSLLVQAEADDQISASVIDDRERRFAALPGSGWAESYGGGWDKVKKLITTSRRSIRRSRWIRFGSIAGGILVLGGMWYVQSRYYQAALETNLADYQELLEANAATIANLRDFAAKTAAPAEAGGVFQDCAECPEMLALPAGLFLMGSPANEEGRRGDEEPLHEVNVPAFAIGKYEVTFDQWDACVTDGGCNHNPNDEGWGRGDRPVINVSWNDAQQYVAWLSHKTGETYRLPSEAEWEYAARAGTVRRFFWGDDVESACRFANGNDETSEKVNEFPWTAFPCDDGFAQTAPIGSFQSNHFGLHDMSGNVWEWVEDRYHDSYKGAPTDGSAWDEGKDSARVLRGGSWGDSPDILRSAGRYRIYPDVRSRTVGFRVSRMLTPLNL